MNEGLRRLGKGMLWVVGRVPHAILNAIDASIVRRTGDPALFPVERLEWREEVEALYPAIRAEVLGISRHVAETPTVHDILPMTHLSYSARGWHQLFFHLYGRWFTDNCESYPAVTQALRRIPRLRNASLSILRPGEDVPPHEHIYKGFLIFHLPIVVPTDGDCALRIAGETVHWEEGKLFAIDPTQEHEVWNKTSHDRLVLLGEFSRPGLPGWYRVFDWMFMAMFNYSPAGHFMRRKIRTHAAQHRAELEAERTPNGETGLTGTSG